MAFASVNVRVGAAVSPGAPVAQSQSQPQTQFQPSHRTEPVKEVEAEVIGVSKTASDPKRRPSNREIVEHAAHALDAVSGSAQALGAEGVSDVAREAANVARAVPAAVEGVQREIAPAKKAIGGLWNALERRGIVGRRDPVNMAALQGRDRPTKVKK